MAIAFVRYPLHNGYIHNWLVGGPQVETQNFASLPTLDITDLPVERGSLTEGTFTVEGEEDIPRYEGVWTYTRCAEDHFVNLSTYRPTRAYLRAWAYAQVEVPQAQDMTFALTTTGPADVWINQTHVHSHQLGGEGERAFHADRHPRLGQETCGEQEGDTQALQEGDAQALQEGDAQALGEVSDRHPQPWRHRTVTFEAALNEGVNEILVRFEAVALHACPYVMALQLTELAEDQSGHADEVSVRIPTAIKNVSRRNKLERVFDAAYLDQTVYQSLERIIIRWQKDPHSDEQDALRTIVARLRDPAGQFHYQMQGVTEGEKGYHTSLGVPCEYPEGAYEVVLTCDLNEYFHNHLRMTHTLKLWAMDNNVYAGDGLPDEDDQRAFQDRRLEALKRALREKNIWGEIAKMRVGWWSRLDVDGIVETITAIHEVGREGESASVGRPAANGEERASVGRPLANEGESASVGRPAANGEERASVGRPAANEGEQEGGWVRSPTDTPYLTDLVGLLGMVYRFGDAPDFPDAVRTPLERCLLDFPYWPPEPRGGSESRAPSLSAITESQRILYHTFEILAGQLYPERTFTATGQTGQWHRERGERLALAWMRARGSGGFAAWDAPRCVENNLVALVHLIEFAECEGVWEMAGVLMDKIFFTLALNSYKGIFGSTHGRVHAPDVYGGLLDPTAGISRLMWGMGVFNHHIRGTISLACMEEYAFPRLFQVIAADLPEEMWSRERQGEAYRSETSPNTSSEGRGATLLNGERGVDKVTYKTPDYMLCSAQDYRPGEWGSQQHIWQATLGPAAVVFVTHPACMGDHNAQRPNFWCGNRILPRVAQWKDVLIAVHNALPAPEADWLGFTHAYFPAHAFDAYTLREDAEGHLWAFAQKGEGYLALTAAQPMQLIEQGPYAYRELRSYGWPNVWLCHMGRAALDGDFDAFQAKVLALDVAFEGPSVRCETLRGEQLAFGWEGPLLRDGEAEPITGFKHYENPYCVADVGAESMDIRFGNQGLRLHLT
jgi:hypothetical protein